MSPAHFYIDRDILVPHDGIYSLDVHMNSDTVKTDSHIACHAHAVPLPCRALIHTCHATPLPCFNSAVSLVKVRVVAGNIRTASPTV